MGQLLKPRPSAEKVGYFNKERVISDPSFIRAGDPQQAETARTGPSTLENGEILAPPPPPSNDECASASLIAINGGDFTYTNSTATAAGSDPSPSNWSNCTGGPSNNIDHTVWFTFTVSGGPRNLSFSSSGTMLNAEIERADYAVFSGTCGSLTEIGSETFGSKRMNITNLANGTYYIMTDGLCSQNGTFKIRVDDTPSGSPTLWYPVTALPVLSAGVPVSTGGQWGTFAASGEPSTSCSIGMQFSDWYQFTYNPSTMAGLHITDHDQQAAFILALYNSTGTEINCNRWGSTSGYPSYTWDLSSQAGIAMHMANMALNDLGLTTGATYYVRIASNSATRYNASDAGDSYTVVLGNFAQSADLHQNNVTLTLTQQPTYSYLNGQSNLRASESTSIEVEGTASGFAIENSMIYRFNSLSATMVDVSLRNVVYFNHLASTALGQLSVQTSPTGGTTLATNGSFTGGTVTLNVPGMSPNTDYYIVVDGAGTYQGTRLSFDISVSTPQPLPVSLNYFEGWLAGSGVQLQWETSNESNNAYFRLERAGASGDFETISRIPGQTFSNTLQEYSFLDQVAFPGLNQYTLWQVDANGLETDLGLVSVVVPTDPGMLIVDRIAPVPAQEEVSLNLVAGSAGQVHSLLIDMRGRILAEDDFAVLAGPNSVQIDLRGLADGIYFVTLQKGNATVTQKLLKR